MEKSVESGRFVFWRMIIRPPFRSEWWDRAEKPLLGLQEGLSHFLAIPEWQVCTMRLLI